MKNYYLIAAGVAIGMGLIMLSSNRDLRLIKEGKKTEEQIRNNNNIEAVFEFVGGALLLVIGFNLESKSTKK